jgi:uncharacterized protein YndB with AHSA1/START domain
VLKARWFAGSADALGAGYELDFRVGGHEVNRGGPPGGPVYTYESQFRDIVPEQRIVYTYEMFADENRLSVSVATVQFHNRDATTQLVLTEQGVFLDGHDTRGPAGRGNPVSFWTRWPGSCTEEHREGAHPQAQLSRRTAMRWARHRGGTTDENLGFVHPHQPGRLLRGPER